MPKKAAPKNNHITEHTIALVVRIPKTVKGAYEREAQAAGVPVAELVKQDLALGLKRRGWVLTPETKEASGL